MNILNYTDKERERIAYINNAPEYTVCARAAAARQYADINITAFDIDFGYRVLRGH